MNVKLVSPVVILCITGCATLTVHPIPELPARTASSPRLDQATWRRLALIVEPSQEESHEQTQVWPSSPPLSVRNYSYLPDGEQFVRARLEAALLEKGYNVVERLHLSRVLEEHDLTLAGIVGDEDAIRGLGALLKADAILYVEMPVFRGRLVWKRNAYGYVAIYLYEIELFSKMIDVQLGEVLWSCSLRRSAEGLLDKRVTLTSRAVLQAPVQDFGIPGSGRVVDAAVNDMMAGFPKAAE